MKQKELIDYTYEELINKLTGDAIMSLGAGKSMRTIVADCVHLTNMWTWEVVKKQEQETKKDKK